MNVHHYELFYYVAKYRGITNAARNMPYGIQAPAISKQMTAFEDFLGHRLFERDPFRLTPAGELVAVRATELITGILRLTEELKHGTGIRWRVCSSEWVLEKQVSGLITFLHRHDVKATFQLTPAGHTQMERWLCDNVVDLAIGPINEHLPAGVEAEPLVEIPLALFVPKGKEYAHIKSADYFWSHSPIKEPLVCPTPNELVGRTFVEELERRNIKWPIYIAYGSMAPVIRYVADGHGVGVAPNFSPLVGKAAVRVLALEGFPKITIGAMWQKAGARPRISLGIMRRMANEVCPEFVVPVANDALVRTI